MSTFLVIAGAVAALVGLAMVWPLLTGSRRGRGRDAAEIDLYRDQIAELDREVARGVISEAEAEGARAEIARRLIAATRRAGSADEIRAAPRQLSRVVAAIALVVPAALASAIYWQIGSPGQPDLPLANRGDPSTAGMPSQEDAERMMAGRMPAPAELDPEYAALLKRLEDVVADRPNDIEGHRLLAHSLARAGRWAEARETRDRLMELLGGAASADDYADHAETLIFAAGGYVSPRAVGALEQSLRIEPAHDMARYYAGFALRQAGRPEQAVELWRTLLREDTAAAASRGPEWRHALEALIAETEGVAAAPGPTREDVEAAGEMSEEDRAAFIGTMVARLEERLTSEGGSAEEWVRLINAYVQLGKPDDARRILALSQESLSDRGERGFVRERALLMGLEAE